MYRARSALRHGQMSEAFSTMVFLTLSGGLQDAYTYCVRGEVFANAQTGNIVLMSQRAFAGDLAGVLRYLIPLLAFALGVFAAEMVRRRCQEISRLHWRQLVALAEIGLLLGVGFLPPSLDAPANALVSFTCAMQVQAFRKVNGSAYASTMCIGNLRSGVDALCVYWDTWDRTALRKALSLEAVLSQLKAVPSVELVLPAPEGAPYPLRCSPLEGMPGVLLVTCRRLPAGTPSPAP